jgi:small subunit ribosomal protein S17
MVAEKKTKAAKIQKAEEDKKIAEQTTREETKYPIRGNIFEGKVISAKANKTVTIERQLIQYLAKYERYKKIRSRIKAHNPTSINAKEGDWVRVGETRRISKTKNFVVMEILNNKKQ